MDCESLFFEIFMLVIGWKHFIVDIVIVTEIQNTCLFDSNAWHNFTAQQNNGLVLRCRLEPVEKKAKSQDLILKNTSKQFQVNQASHLIAECLDVCIY